MFKTPLSLAVLLFALTGGFAVAQAGEHASEERFRALDENGNGYISLYEAEGHRIFYFYDSANADNDGHIDLEEFKAFEAKHMSREAKR